jgi:hypothetical protein
MQRSRNIHVTAHKVSCTFQRLMPMFVMVG